MNIIGIYPNFTFEEFFPQTSEVTSCPMYVEILAIENSRTYEVNIIQELETDFSKLKIVNEDSIILNYTILPNDPRELGISLKLKRNK
ncbi:hypothetical protein BC781_1322 [Sediminitomix flava]|uniref:Uncharacterized protein n=2 Tax=Sediminitomix flava TaxID=379075 RepID=A0A315YP96_SEDFL|nr:hypothetical protein BC781_1322 [Sediminitomix flava]